MTQTKSQNILHIVYVSTNNFYGYAMSKFLPTNGFKWINPKEFDSNKYSNNSSKGCVLEVDLEYLKELHEFHNDYLLAADKIEIITEILFNHQLKIFGFCDIPIITVNKMVPNFFDTENYVLYYHFRLGLKLNKFIVY